MSILDVESTLTDRYQTTVPEAVRKTLGLRKRDRVHYAIQPDGTVLLSRATTDDDSALEPFLALLLQDFMAHPERLAALSPALRHRIDVLVGGMDVDLEESLGDEQA